MAADQVTLVLDKSNLSSQQNHRISTIKCISVRHFLALLFGVVVIVVLLTFRNVEYSNSVGIPFKSSQLQGEVETYVGNQTLAKYLEREVRVLCWIMTSPASHKSKALHVKKTWGKRCTKLLFVTTQEDDELETLLIDIEEKYENLWGKTRNAFKYLYENHLNDFDWFMKADDDTYVFVENLRYMLYPYSPDMPLWFGFNFNWGGGNNVYMSGGSGYTLSREALRRFGSVALNSPDGCKLHDDTGPEDGEMGLCLKNVNVIAADSRDDLLKFRYSPFRPHSFLISKFFSNDHWLWSFSSFHLHGSRDSLSNNAVAFHYVPPEEMYIFEYLVYGFEAVGLAQPEERLPRKLRSDDVVAPVSDNEWGNARN